MLATNQEQGSFNPFDTGAAATHTQRFDFAYSGFLNLGANAVNQGNIQIPIFVPRELRFREVWVMTNLPAEDYGLITLSVLFNGVIVQQHPVYYVTNAITQPALFNTQIGNNGRNILSAPDFTAVDIANGMFPLGKTLNLEVIADQLALQFWFPKAIRVDMGIWCKSGNRPATTYQEKQNAW